MIESLLEIQKGKGSQKCGGRVGEGGRRKTGEIYSDGGFLLY